MPLPQQTNIFRGATAYFSTNFYDVNGNIIQPPSAYINIDYPNPDGSRSNPQLEIPMIPPGGLVTTWTAEWDTRGAGIGTVYWSIHSDDPIPIAVQDGTFQLIANNANLETF